MANIGSGTPSFLMVGIGVMPRWMRRPRHSTAHWWCVQSVDQAGRSPRQHAPFSLECEGEARLEVAALKPAEDGIGVILRVVEKHGAHGVARVHVPAHAGAEVVDLREQPVELPGFNWDSDTSVVRFPVRPFGITTIRLHL